MIHHDLLFASVVVVVVELAELEQQHGQDLFETFL